MNKRTQVSLGLGLSVVLFAAGAFGFVRTRDTDRTATPPIANVAAVAAFTPRSAATLDDVIAALQQRLETTPEDDVAWSSLGLAYVQQAKVTANSDFYPRADGALEQSLAINDDDNFLAYAGLSALASARHDFAAARDFALTGLSINGFSAILYGALSDAELQLGNYDDAFIAVQRMVDLAPNAASLSRASYTWELRGDAAQAAHLMQRALDDAPTPSDKAFAHVYLGELAFDAGNPNEALTRYIAALDASPADPAALAGRAKAEAALGQYETALGHYAELVQRAPEPSYLVDYGELLESLGRDEEAQRQYALFDDVQQLFAANGVEPDAAATLFDANRGNVDRALADAEAGITTRPFLAMHDAHAWALHAAGRDEEALAAAERALSLGRSNALYLYHSGMIKHALGDQAGAVADLRAALDINPYFNPLAAPIAASTLAELEA